MGDIYQIISVQNEKKRCREYHIMINRQTVHGGEKKTEYSTE